MDRFGPLVREEDYSETTNMGTGMRCIFLYSGIHLDIISSGEFIAPFLSLTFLASILILFDSFLIYLTFLPPFPVVISNSFISLDVDHQIWTSIWTPRSSPDYDPILQAAKKLGTSYALKRHTWIRLYLILNANARWYWLFIGIRIRNRALAESENGRWWPTNTNAHSILIRCVQYSNKAEASKVKERSSINFLIPQTVSSLHFSNPHSR